MRYHEVNQIWEKMKEKTSLSDEAMVLVGYSKEKIDNAIHLLINKGVSRKQAVKQIYRLFIFNTNNDNSLE